MPELPEVEVVKRSLTRKVQNLIIQKVNIKDSKLRYHLDKNKFRKIRGLRIKKIERKSKFLLFFLNKNFIMMVHLGMTGKFFFVDRKNTKLKTSFYYNIDYKKEQKYDRVEFILNKNQKLIYNDVRKFGFIKLLSNKKYKAIALYFLFICWTAFPLPFSKFSNSGLSTKDDNISLLASSSI